MAWQLHQACLSNKGIYHLEGLARCTWQHKTSYKEPENNPSHEFLTSTKPLTAYRISASFRGFGDITFWTTSSSDFQLSVQSAPGSGWRKRKLWLLELWISSGVPHHSMHGPIFFSIYQWSLRFYYHCYRTKSNVVFQTYRRIQNRLLTGPHKTGSNVI